MRRISKQLRQTAFHESGHAVIARVLTLDCGGASVEADHECAGHIIINEPFACGRAWEQRGKVRENDAVFHARIIAYMAGAESAELLGDVRHAGDGYDRHQIALMAEQLESADESWHRIEARLRAMTRMLVRRHRALIDRKTLSREELDALVGRGVDDVKVNAPFLLAMHRERLT
jgi:hypothetical protein